jgi:ABC-2 type transport system ATP-binding protein
VSAGYAVLTWDARGFGCSGGEAQLDDPQVEGRDVSALIDWASTHVPVSLDGPGDPVVGMTGESYGGGVQLAAVSLDPRIDAIAPMMTWSDLEYAVFPGGVAKLFEIALIAAAGTGTSLGEGLDPSCLSGPQTGSVDPTLTTLTSEAIATDQVSDEFRAYMSARSLTSYGGAHPVAIPTLVVQGSTDTLFPIRQALGTFQHVSSHGAPSRLLVTCGGHGQCSPQYVGGSDLPHVFDAIVRWFDRYLKGNSSVDVGPPVEYHTNTGEWRELPGLDPAGTIGGTVAGSVVTVPVADPADPIPFLTRLILDGVVDASTAPQVAAQPSDAADPRAMIVPLAEAGAAPIQMFGLPTVRLTISGVGGPTTNLFVKLVDRELAEVVNLEEAAIRVPVGSLPATIDVAMPGVAYTLAAGHHLDLEIASHSSMHAMSRYPSVASITADVAVPLPEPATGLALLGALPLLARLAARRRA